MNFKVVSILPQLIVEGMKYGVVGSGFKKGLLSLEVIDPRIYSVDVHKTVDDRPFGGGDGMVMLPQSLELAFEDLNARSTVSAPEKICIYLSPQGKPWTAALASEYAGQFKEITLLCGRYAGVDQRVLNSYVDIEISTGDYVVSGGEVPALILMDSIGRHIPGVLGHSQSAQRDSFNGGLLEAPLFTRPREWRQQWVPDVLLSGDHHQIAQWQFACSLWITLQKRPDLFAKFIGTVEDSQRKFIFKKMRDFLQKLSLEDKQVLNLKIGQEGILPYEQELSASVSGIGSLPRL